MRIVNGNQGPLVIGRRGENLVTEVQFDISVWQEEFGVGTARLLVQRCGDTAAYAAAIRVEGGKVCWPISSADTARVGQGSAQLQYQVGERLAVAQTVSFFVGEALTDSGAEAPDPLESWLDRVIAATGHYPRIGANGNWQTWSVDEQVWIDSGITVQQGPAGKSAYQTAAEGGYSGSELQFRADLAQVSSKQNAYDNTLTTQSKTVVGAINELEAQRIGHTVQVTAGILAENPGKAISSSYSGIYNLANTETSHLYPCVVGDTVVMRVYASATSRIVLATYAADGSVVRRVTASEAGATAGGVVELIYTFQTGEAGFRVSHSLSTVGTDFEEFVVYQDGKNVNAMRNIVPEMFGAVGDGVTDDTAALQHMFDYAYWNPCTIVFPNGRTYLVGSPIYLRAYSREICDINGGTTITTGSHSYSCRGDNYSVTPCLRINTTGYCAMFCGENFRAHPNNVYATSVNAKFDGVSACVYDDANVKATLFKGLRFINESVFDLCKFTNFDVCFEGSTVSVVSEIRSCTFYGIMTAFMTNKHRDSNGEFTIGEDVGFLADSKIVNCYISGHKSYFPSCFVGTHADKDTHVIGCFIEFMRYIVCGGYASGFKGLRFDNCDIQYCYRMASKGILNCTVSETFFSSFAADRLNDTITWSGISALTENPVGVICTNVDDDGHNTEAVNFDVRFDNCHVVHCDHFIHLNGGSTSAYNFHDSYISERGTVYSDDSEEMTEAVVLQGNLPVNCYSDTLNHIELSSSPVASENGVIHNAFNGQIVTYNNATYYATATNGELVYRRLGSPIQGVKLAGTALSPDSEGSVNVPAAEIGGGYGLVKLASGTGLTLANGKLALTKATDADIAAHSSSYKPIVPANMDAAVKAAMTDGVGAAWTDAERTAALLRMGCTVDGNGFVRWTTQG